MNSSHESDTFWKPFVRMFQFVGVSHYAVFRPHLKRNFLKSGLFALYFIILAFVHFWLVILAATKGLSCLGDIPADEYEQRSQLMKHKESTLMFHVNSASVIGGIITHVLSNFETFLNGKFEERIFQQFSKIDEIFATKLNYITDFKKRRANFIRILGIFIFATVLAIFSALIDLPILYSDKYFMTPMLIFPVIVNRSRWCYIALFLTHIGDILNDLQALLKQQQIHSCDESSSIPESRFYREKIRYYREIYSSVWFTTTLLSDCFGWSLIFFIVEFIVETLNAAYWLYINMHVYGLVNLNIHILLYNVSITIVLWHFCMLSERCQNMGRAVTKALHTPSNYHDDNYQGFVRIFSLQIREQCVEITMKQLVTLNNALFKSVIVLITTYVAIVIQFQITDENAAYGLAN